MTIKVITSIEELNQNEAYLRELLHKTNKQEYIDEINLLKLVIRDFQQKNQDFLELNEALDPIDLIKIRMEDFGYKQKDLANLYGSKGDISDVINKKRPLTLKMMRIFSEKLRIPIQKLIIPYELTH